MTDKTDMAKAASWEMQAPASDALTPMGMLQIAVQQGADIDKIQKLMDLQERWEKKEAEKAYTTAMSAFRAECPAIDKTRSGHNSTYAGLSETIEQIKGLLAKNGLSHSWKVDQNEKTITVKTCITHVQGHQECTSITGPHDTSGSKNAIQAIASSISYLERYGLFAILGLASKEQDDDGQGATIEWITPEQVATMAALIEELGVKESQFLRRIRAESLERIQSVDYDRCIKLLETKRK